MLEAIGRNEETSSVVKSKPLVKVTQYHYYQADYRNLLVYRFPVNDIRTLRDKNQCFLSIGGFGSFP